LRFAVIWANICFSRTALMAEALMAKKAAPKAEPKKNGRPPHVPTPVSRRTVTLLASVGFNQQRIAANLEIDPVTLRLHYRRELDHSTEIMCANALVRLVKASSSGIGMASVKASIAILACRGGWKETSKVEVEQAGRGVTAVLDMLRAAEEGGLEELALADAEQAAGQVH
jgi:hypothetical protein